MYVVHEFSDNEEFNNFFIGCDSHTYLLDIFCSTRMEKGSGQRKMFIFKENRKCRWLQS
ncbi:uncharacterized protein LOC6739812 isoform X7 [Drosophila simulans]|uniref:uncharacterized protein LOC6739812 isoform X7 n=1 Tax=Drosophila simulans TaxID=7240 RepID=UPI001D105044|nr:uncharacterized protein LOC6739812 isoform X7 [Drosophila simulans]